MRDLIKIFEEIREEFHEDMRTFIEEEIVPLLKEFCEEYGLTYRSGNGTWLFCRADGRHLPDWFDEDDENDSDLTEEFRETYEEVMHLLYLEIEPDLLVGFWVPDIG